MIKEQLIDATRLSEGEREEPAKQGTDSICVVPNPSVATSVFHPSNGYKSGRGKRRIYFMNLPEQCIEDSIEGFSPGAGVKMNLFGRRILATDHGFKDFGLFGASRPLPWM